MKFLAIEEAVLRRTERSQGNILKSDLYVTGHHDGPLRREHNAQRVILP